MEQFDFEDIRPYTDSEVPVIIERLLRDETFFRVMSWIYPHANRESLSNLMRSVTSVREFQEKVSGPAFKVLEKHTTNGLGFENSHNLVKNKPYLFLSNHRDIILDSAFLNVLLIEGGFETTQIAIGDNLLRNPVITDLVRLNKNFIVNRNIPARDVLQNSKRLSEYIRRVICDKKESVWIAHREGRSKDGDDRTANGLLKMLALSGEGSLSHRLRSLHILPMAVSYEYDPCDVMKVNELMVRRATGSYRKKPGEDYRSMLNGLMGHKGHVSISVGKVFDEQLQVLDSISNKNDAFRFLAMEIDREMHLMYKLWPVNYIAYDMLHEGSTYSRFYSGLEYTAFSNYVQERLSVLLASRRNGPENVSLFKAEASAMLLQMYANPVVNKQEAQRQMNYLDENLAQ
jgi:1-acyl-sn-glycerol-3-phosphate acyltransferase